MTASPQPGMGSRGNIRRWRLAVPALCGAALLVLTGCGPNDDDATAAPEEPGVQTEEEAAAPPEAEPEAAAEVADDDEPQAETDGVTDTGLTPGDIIAAVEPHGFECAEEEPVLKSRSDKVVCEGPNYAYITATKLVDEAEMGNQLTKAKDALCDSDFTDEDDAMRTAVSGAWVIVPGGSDENNLALYDAAMTDLGLEWTEDSCAA